MTAWFIVKSGQHKGRPHLSGWRQTAIRADATRPGGEGWLEYSCCPVCAAMVVADETHAYGDLTWEHEQWHARTDFPIPAELLAAAGKDAG